MKNITLWIPADTQPNWNVITPCWNLKTPGNKRLRLIPGRAISINIRQSWNNSIKYFLDETTDEWIFSVHNDVVVDPETLMRLLSWNKPLISALIFMRAGPALPHIWKQYDNSDGRMVMRINDTRAFLYKHPEYMANFTSFVMHPKPKDALVEIDFTSTSCTLIHRSVLEAMRPLVKDIWFEWDDDTNGGGEDRRFFINAKQSGFQAYVDRSCVVGHLRPNVVTSVADFVAWDSVSVYQGTGEVIEKANGA